MKTTFEKRAHGHTAGWWSVADNPRGEVAEGNSVQFL